MNIWISSRCSNFAPCQNNFPVDGMAATNDPKMQVHGKLKQLGGGLRMAGVYVSGVQENKESKNGIEETAHVSWYGPDVQKGLFLCCCMNL